MPNYKLVQMLSDWFVYTSYVNHYLIFVSSNQCFTSYHDRWYPYFLRRSALLRPPYWRPTKIVHCRQSSLHGRSYSRKQNFEVSVATKSEVSKHPQAWQIILTSCLQRVLLFFSNWSHASELKRLSWPIWTDLSRIYRSAIGLNAFFGARKSDFAVVAGCFHVVDSHSRSRSSAGEFAAWGKAGHLSETSL